MKRMISRAVAPVMLVLLCGLFTHAPGQSLEDKLELQRRANAARAACVKWFNLLSPDQQALIESLEDVEFGFLVEKGSAIPLNDENLRLVLDALEVDSADAQLVESHMRTWVDAVSLSKSLGQNWPQVCLSERKRELMDAVIELELQHLNSTKYYIAVNQQTVLDVMRRIGAEEEEAYFVLAFMRTYEALNELLKPLPMPE